MYKRVKKKILMSILTPIANTEGKLEDKADYIFSCLMRKGIVSDSDRPCFIREFFGHINKMSDDFSNMLDKAVMKALKKMNISVENGDKAG
ncbi:MAG: hypothetical protein ACMUIL_04185 [bacterium]